MVNPVIFIAALLGFAFIYPLAETIGRTFARGIALIVMAFFTLAAVSWLLTLASGAPVIETGTAGFSAPLSINLAVGVPEAAALTAVFLAGFGALFHLLFRKLDPWQGKRVVLFFIQMLGAAGLILTRDIFNLFVFMEISSLSLFGFLSTSRDERIFEGGFKYMVASGLASAFFLIGVALVYREAGTLSIDGIIEARDRLQGFSASMGLLLLLTGVLIELKPAPANGWALDTYEAADHGIGSMMSAVGATAMAMVLFKVLPIFSSPALPVFKLLVIAGAGSFLISQFGALRQESYKRMLGYSSTAQISLVVMIAGLTPVLQHPLRGSLLTSLAAFIPGGGPAAGTTAIVLLLLVNHALAKAGLFWIGGALKTADTGGSPILPASLRGRPVLLTLLGIFVAALVGLPPFPAFWAKWSLIMALGQSDSILVMALVLAGSLAEAVYLLRFFVMSARSSQDTADILEETIPGDFEGEPPVYDAGVEIGPGGAPQTGLAGNAKEATAYVPGSFVSGGVPALLAAAVLTLLGAGCALAAGVSTTILLPFAAMVLFALLDLLRFPVRLQLPAAMAVIGLYGWYLLPDLEGMRQLFALMFIAGSLVQLVAFMNRRGREPGTAALLTALILSLGALTVSVSNLDLFISWETMTLTSFLLIQRGRRAAAGALWYISFSLGGAYLLLSGLALLGEGTFVTAAGTAPSAAILIALGLLVKLGALGLHIWLPVAYAEAEDDFSSLISSVLSKAGLFVLFLGAGFFAPLVFGGTGFSGIPLSTLIGWLGVATALAGAMMALFQEDIKYALAYSSMGQVGYMVLTWATMSHLGWIASLYLAVTHLMFKAMLFLAVAGVINRTGTRLMYQMGGLIKRMPLSFISVLFAIIALSGVPPLTGFGAKWLMYSALIEKGWYLQAGLAMFSSGVAFLYLFRLIHSIFLGQRKPIYHDIKEAPAWFIIPQMIFLVVVFAFSMFPKILIVPLQKVIEPYFSSSVVWEGYSVISSLGYWNGSAVMYVTIGVFIAPLLWLLLTKGRVYRVEQFNIVYAAERPYKPETTHYAYNFFGHYRKALGFLADPLVRRFWQGTVEAAGQISGALRRINTGNTQTYSLQILVYFLLAYLITRGGF
ncbi:proton-conducting transporter membrane subunit [Marispirochaeta aestuarii]|uniref:proton-conducting transporter transmembrane domain-containing protein n=1 Tax=Marispirochaeta aestuarii TaxID=1963862 RepID=UPI0029C814F4|nr:proton-conducting transporter membrane subunit [Marispirochaeta aestuarii]